MIDGRLRNVKARALAPLVSHLRGVSPTALSWAGLAVGLGAAAAAAAGAFGWALGLWLLNRVLDGLDGEVARAHGRSSDLGGYIDLVVDFVVYVAVPLGIAVHVGAYAAVAVVLGAYYVNAVSWLVLSQLLERRSAAGAHRGPTSVAMPTGVMEGAETAVAYVVLLLFPQHFQLFMFILAGVVLVTAAQHVGWAHRHLQHALRTSSEKLPVRDSTIVELKDAA